jgi:membrane protein implicated in regulation of membrane protease activity
MGNPKMLVVFTLGAAILVGVVASLATNNWLLLVFAVAIHAIVSVIVLGFTFKRIEEGDKPDPVTAAHMEAGDADRGDGLTDSGRYGDREVTH